MALEAPEGRTTDTRAQQDMCGGDACGPALKLGGQREPKQLSDLPSSRPPQRTASWRLSRSLCLSVFCNLNPRGTAGLTGKQQRLPRAGRLPGLGAGVWVAQFTLSPGGARVY